jgi:tRNA-splicing ligase RtcB
MCAVKTNLTLDSFCVGALKSVMGEIRKVVPVGFSHHKEKCSEQEMPITDGIDTCPKVKEQYEKARTQLGTLGGGNHFIEIQKDSFGCIWIMIHSGSRNLGKQVADHYNKIAKELNSKWHTSVDAKSDLAFLPMDTQEAKNYFNEMNYCLAFSKANRAKMLEAIKGCFRQVNPDSLFGETLDIQHNYAAWENHFGHNVIIHRKGATMARLGQQGIIPGSQGTSSYIVEGLGNPDSFMSCSHGAGRRMGRKEAERTLDLAGEIKRMDDKGIIHAIRGKSELDEAPSAYKDIDVVMEEQSDLVKIITRLEPMGVIKG